MPYAAIRAAILERFATYGADPASQVAPTFHASTKNLPFDAVSLLTRLGGRPKAIPVYEIDKAGQNVEVWPAITFCRVDENFRADDYYHPNAVLRKFSGTAFQHDRITQVERYGAEQISFVDYPEPIDVFYELQTWSLSVREEEEMLTVLKQIFPARTFLRLKNRDGTLSDAGFFRRSGPSWRGGKDPTLEPGDPGARFYSWTMVYRCEAYEDNTLETSTLPTVLERRFGLAGLGTEETDPEELPTFTPDEAGRS